MSQKKWAISYIYQKAGPDKTGPRPVTTKPEPLEIHHGQGPTKDWVVQKGNSLEGFIGLMSWFDYVLIVEGIIFCILLVEMPFRLCGSHDFFGNSMGAPGMMPRKAV